MNIDSFNGQTPEAKGLYRREAEEMEHIKREVLGRLANLVDGKLIYDMHFPWWQKHIFGDASFAHELFKKAARAASLVAASMTGDTPPNEYTDALEDHIMDAINFCVMWLAWRKYLERRASHASSSHHAVDADPFGD